MYWKDHKVDKREVADFNYMQCFAFQIKFYGGMCWAFKVRFCRILLIRYTSTLLRLGHYFILIICFEQWLEGFSQYLKIFHAIKVSKKPSAILCMHRGVCRDKAAGLYKHLFYCIRNLFQKLHPHFPLIFLA